MSRLRTLIRAEGGTATLEFAFISIFMFAIIMVALDFGVYVQQKLRLSSAVEQASVLAFKTQNASSIAGYVQTVAQTTRTPTVQVTCNGTSTCGDGKCSCLTAAGAVTAAASCNSACPSGEISGNYVKIVAQADYPAIVVPDRWLGGSKITQIAVVRLQ